MVKIMKAIIDLLKEDFRKRKEKNPKYSLRSYANALGVHSGSLSHIMNGNRKVSKSTLNNFVKALGLSDQELKDIQDIDILITMQYKAKYHLNQCYPWYYDAFLELAEAVGICQVQQIKSHLKISSHEVKKMLKDLSQLGRVKIEANNKLNIQSPDSTYLEKLENLLPSISNQRKTLEKALSSVDGVHMNSMSLKITKSELERIQEKIKDLHLEILFNSHSRAHDESEEIYQLNIQLFPVSSLGHYLPENY